MMDINAPIRIAVMGCADIADRKVIPAIKELPGEFQLVAVASRSEEKADRFARKFNCEPITGYDPLLNRTDVSAIYLPLPTGLHEEWVLKALETGKHLFVEKSLAESYSSAEKMIQLAEVQNLLVMENFMFCYHSQHDFVQKLIDEERIGKLRVMRSSFGFPPLQKDNFRYVRHLGGGSLLDAGAYTLKATSMFLGSDVRVLGAHLCRDNPEQVDLGGGALLRNEEGVVSQVAFGFNNYYQCSYELWGSSGKITVERAFTPPLDLSPVVTVESNGNSEKFELPPDDQFKNILLEFSRSLRDRDFRGHVNDSLTQARLIQKVIDYSK